MNVAKTLGILLGILIFMHVPGAAEEPKKGTRLKQETSMGFAIGQTEFKQGLADVEEDLKMYGRLKDPGQTWVESEGKIYGAKPDKRGPIGGGKGYTQVITNGDYRVSGLDELLEALKKAKAGQIVYVDDKAVIDCTTRVYIEKLVIDIPGGVTLASGRGHAGSRGAMIFSDTFSTRPLIRTRGADVRITGLRIRGPDPERRMYHHNRSYKEGYGSKYWSIFPVSVGIETTYPGVQVDNCELAGWSQAAIMLKNGAGHYIHHNFIHHNQCNGLGYGICLDIAEALIDYNLFNSNRHSIAGTGRTVSGYEAAHNVELGESLDHCFDMHGGSDRKDGTDIAGTWIKIHHNTFRALQTPINIRGTPEKECQVYENWFPNHTNPKDKGGKPAALHKEKTVLENNRYRLPDNLELSPKQR